MAPATKYGGKIVVCQPGRMEVAKSIDTMVCTDNTSGVDIPARTKETSSNRCQFFEDPVHPKASKPYQNLLALVLALSLTTAKSGIKPVYQKTRETEKYVETANVLLE